jgi:hypothetical protein
MGKKGHSEEKILWVLRETEAGETIVEVYRKHGVASRRTSSGRRTTPGWV